VEDAICATKAAVKEGIVSGGGIALLDASLKLKQLIKVRRYCYKQFKLLGA
jgi:chaperonin GroEL (HSP60 family)